MNQWIKFYLDLTLGSPPNTSWRLPITTQVRLLRVLENGEFIKVGSSEVHKTNVRIVAATNLDMESAIRKGKFREDLFYRLSTVEIKIPPLRNRKDDIHLLFFPTLV